MADIDVARKPGGQNTWLWAVVAILAVGGLMVWLAIQSQRVNTAAVVQEDTVQADEAAPAAGEQVELAALGLAPQDYEGEQVEVAQVPVAAVLGPRAFWGEIPGANPFLVVLGSGVQAPGELAAGQSYRVRGTVRPVTEEVLDSWVEGGVINPGARDEAGFATHYLEAQALLR